MTSLSGPSENSILPDRIRLTREERRMSQLELGRICGFGVNQISRYETGSRDPSASVLKKISTALGVSIDYLVGLTNEPHGQIAPSDLNVYELEMVEVFRREGWQGIAHLSVEKLSER